MSDERMLMKCKKMHFSETIASQVLITLYRHVSEGG